MLYQGGNIALDFNKLYFHVHIKCKDSFGVWKWVSYSDSCPHFYSCCTFNKDTNMMATDDMVKKGLGAAKTMVDVLDKTSSDEEEVDIPVKANKHKKRASMCKLLFYL